MALGNSAMWKRDCEGIAEKQARANHMALWAGLGEQFQLGRRATLSAPISASGSIYEKATGIVAPMIQNMQTMGDVEQSKGSKELDKIDVREVQRGIISQAMLGADDLHLNNIGLVPIEQDSAGNVVRYGVRFFDDDSTFGPTNNILLYSKGSVAAVRICLLGTHAAGLPLSQEIRDHILRWDPKRCKEEFLNQPGPESKDDKMAAAHALERRLCSLQEHLRSEPAATARSSVFAMYPLAEFSWLAGLLLYDGDEFAASLIVGDLAVPLEEIIRALFQEGLLTQAFATKLLEDLSKTTPPDLTLWQQATKELQSKLQIKETP